MYGLGVAAPVVLQVILAALGKQHLAVVTYQLQFIDHKNRHVGVCACHLLLLKELYDYYGHPAICAKCSVQ